MRDRGSRWSALAAGTVTAHRLSLVELLCFAALHIQILLKHVVGDIEAENGIPT